jgi:predicted XRE-type DNA-binding protein
MDKQHDVREVEIVDGTGNVFADLGLPSTDEDVFKAALARAITNTVRKRDLTQTEAAILIGVDQAQVSKILSGKLRGLSAERLIRMLVALGRDVDIHISERHKNRPGRLRVRAA